jgi:hypothetical protein
MNIPILILFYILHLHDYHASRLTTFITLCTHYGMITYESDVLILGWLDDVTCMNTTVVDNTTFTLHLHSLSVE